MTKSLQQGRKESSLDLAPYKSNYKCRIWLLCLAGVLAVVVCTFSLTGDFVLDDWLVLGEHPIIRNKLPLWQLFFVDQWGNHLSGKVTTYRPLMPLIWWPIWQVSPNNPFVFRLLTLFLHLTATISIILVGNLFIKNKWIVALAAVFFAVFAVHAEVLGSIAHQNEILAFILCLWALYFIEKKYAPPLLSMLLLILAVLIKESAIVFYVVILLYLAARREIGKQILLVVSILLSAVLMIGIQLSLDRAPFIIGNMDNLSHDALGMERLLHGLYTIGKGVLLMLAPVGLAPFHGYASIDLSPVTLLPLAIIGGLALFLGCAVLLWGLWNKLALYVLGSSLLIGPLVLQSNLTIRTFAEISERWLYTPSVVVCFILSAVFIGFFNRLKKKPLRCLAIILPTLYILVHLVISWQVLSAWKTNDSLMSYAVKKEPAAYQSRYFHAKYLLQKDELYEGLWYASTSAMIKKEYFKSQGRSGREKFMALAELDKEPLRRRFGLAPSIFEPRQPCRYVLESISETANLKPPPPRVILNILAGLYASEGFERCFTSPEHLSSPAPLQQKLQ